MPLIRPTRNVRDTWLSQRWREISGGFPAKLTLSSRAAFGETAPDPIRSGANVGNRELGNEAEVVAYPHASDRFGEGEGAGADVECGPV